MDPEAYWYRTPREVTAFLEVVSERNADAKDLALFTAWHTEAFARQKRLPDLNRLLARRKPKAPLPLEAEMARWKGFFAVASGKVGNA